MSALDPSLSHARKVFDEIPMGHMETVTRCISSDGIKCAKAHLCPKQLCGGEERERERVERVEAEMEEMRDWCRALPKIELHAHLNGSIRDSTLLELARVLGEKGVIVFADVEHVIMKNGRSLPECFKLFDLFHILTTDHETVSRITKEVVEDFAAENVVYLELRTTPKKKEAKGMTKRSYMEAVLKGLKAVDTVEVYFPSNDWSTENIVDTVPLDATCDRMTKRKIYVRLLLSIDRRETTTSAMETVNLAMEMRDLGVVGIDLSGNPVIGDWQTYLPALRYAREQGLAITLHCGEVPNRKEIQAMLNFCPQRIGHACCLEEEEWRTLKSSKIPVEICLTSNVTTECVTSIDDHHFVDLYKAKHPLVICTDDRGLFSTSLSNEYYLAVSAFGLDKEETLRLAQTAIDFVFADNGVKKALKEIYAAAEKAEL